VSNLNLAILRPENDFRPEISGAQRFYAFHPPGEKHKTGKVPLIGHSAGLSEKNRSV
jgi:hypothetical protein